jgi:thiosulfate/3-mercaptopyruvate sulfurtransferase
MSAREHTPDGGLRLATLDAMSEYAKDVLVDTQWVENHLSDESIRVVEVDENPALYAEAHIPGAIGFDWKKDLQDQVKRDFLGPAEFGELFGGRGISNDHTIVLYGDRNNWFAAYTYWYLKYYGHDNVRLMNGPREKWISEGRPTSTDVPSYEGQTFNAREGDESIRAYRDEVLAALDSNTSLVDVRSPQEYSGELIAMAGYEQEGAQRAGHIPGAASVPWAQAVKEDGTFKGADELRELYSDRGVVNGNPIIAYCRIGERSAHTWFVLHELLGQGDVKNYDGSWTEWGNMVAVPIEKDV